MIEITGCEGSSEYEAAHAIREALLKLWPDLETTPAETELVRIAANVKISGYKISDIDVVIAARFGPRRFFRPTRVLRDQNERRIIGQPVRAISLVGAIEVKDHDPTRTMINGNAISVVYSASGPRKWSSATGQNVDQAHALKGYLGDRGAAVYVHRLVMMRGFAERPCVGALPRTFSAADLLTTFLEVGTVTNSGRELVLRAANHEAVERVLLQPLFSQLVPTALDRHRMDRIVARDPLLDELAEEVGQKMLRLRGRGGTGKTVMLLHLAWRIFEDRAAKTVVLTYNHALASDIRRILALLNMPAGLDGGGITVRTVMSFISAWLSRLGLAGSSEEWDAAEYERHCQTALDMVREGALTPEDIANVQLADPFQFEVDQVIADEAQDWPEAELELLKALYGPPKICLADGIDQLVRGSSANWDAGVPASMRKVVPLKRCLRMKANLSAFSNAFAERAGLPWSVEPNPFAGGGRVVLLEGSYAKHHELHDGLVQNATAAGNAPVDMLFCVPASNVSLDSQGARRSDLGLSLTGWGYEVWDGVDEEVRRDFPRSSSALRIVQYASCRGLEGWTVVCEGLDRFWAQCRITSAARSEPGMSDAGLSAADASTAAAYRWCLIPLGRAIDTLVIAVDDFDSEFGRLVIGAARSCSDAVEIRRS